MNPNEPRLTISLAMAQQYIDEQIGRGSQLLDMGIGNSGELEEARAERRSWVEYVDTLLKRMFSSSQFADEFSGRTGVSAGSISLSPSLGQQVADYRKTVREYTRRLRSIRDRLEFFNISEQTSPKEEIQNEKGSPQTRRVFIVHGHDTGAREGVARFIDRLGLESVILHERVNQGASLLEKVLREATTAEYAVILLTPDDLGAKVGEPDKLLPRARQNVILELGLFIGMLGPDRVCALKAADVEVPSDYAGIVYVPYDDSEAWKLQLGAELQAVWSDIDLNKVVQ